MSSTAAPGSTSTVSPSGDVDLAMSILTILTTLCQASGRRKKESEECRKAQLDLLNLVDIRKTPWIIRGSSANSQSELERGLMDFVSRSGVSQRDFGLPRSEPLSHEGINWSLYFKGIQGLFAVASDLKDPRSFVQKVKEYLIREPGVVPEKLEVFLGLHQAGGIAQVLDAVYQAERRATYIIIALILFSVLTTAIWLALNLRSYCDQRRARRAQRASKQAGALLREMQSVRRNQLRGIESSSLM